MAKYSPPNGGDIKEIDVDKNEGNLKVVVDGRTIIYRKDGVEEKTFEDGLLRSSRFIGYRASGYSEAYDKYISVVESAMKDFSEEDKKLTEYVLAIVRNKGEIGVKLQ